MWTILLYRKYAYITKQHINNNKKNEKKSSDQIEKERKYEEKLELLYRYNTALMGGAERFILILGFQTIPTVIISGWLAIKFASIWKGWGNNRKNKVDNINNENNDDKSLSGRAIFNNTITGIFLNLIFSIIGYIIIRLGINSQFCCIQKWINVSIIAGITIFFAAIILAISYFFINKKKNIS